jgi:hypothetical protein
MSELPGYFKQSWPMARQFERRTLESRISLSGPDGSEYRGWCNDISEGGLGATVAVPLQLGTEVGLEFAIPISPEPLRLNAVVRYTNGFRFGFEFLKLTPEQRQLVLTYVGGAPKRPTKPAAQRKL